MTLRRWQTEALANYRAWRSKPNTPRIVRAVMGAGKTRLTAEIVAIEARAILAKSLDFCAVVVVPTQRLVVQTAAELRKQALPTGEYWADSKTPDLITVTTYASLGNLAQVLDKPVSLMVLDECHETEAPGVLENVQAINARWLLGLTATPWRSDENETISLFDGCLYDYGPAEALADGVIVPWRIVTAEYEGPLDDWCLEQIRDAPKPCLATADTIEDAEQFAEFLSRQGVPAKAIHSKLKDSGAVLAAWAAGEFGTLVHIDMITRGVDVPNMAALCLRSIIGSRVKLPQTVGRGLRAYPGKSELLILDPHCLFADLGIDYEACLGGKPKSRKPKSVLELNEQDFLDGWMSEEDRDRLAKEVMREMRKDKQLRMVSATKALVVTLTQAWKHAGKIPMRTQRGSWRRLEATDKQRANVAKLGFLTHGALEKDFAALLRRACVDGADGVFNRGVTSDLISLLGIVKDCRRIWPEVKDDTTI